MQEGKLTAVATTVVEEDSHGGSQISKRWRE